MNGQLLRLAETDFRQDHLRLHSAIGAVKQRALADLQTLGLRRTTPSFLEPISEPGMDTGPNQC